MATGTTTVGFEQKLWDAADKLRSNMDAAEYKHVVLGLIFLKYVSDSFTEKYEQLKAEGYGDEEDRDEYMAENIFWVPKDARWEVLRAHATNPDIGEVIDKAMDAIEKENDSLKGVLTKNYSRPELDKVRLGELVTLFSNIEIGSTAAQEKDVLGRVYEYFLGKFASAEGKLGGEFYTPSCVVRTLVEMIEPFDGQIYDPCCGSGGMFCQSARFVKEHQGNIRDISIFGQESNPTTWKLAKMNLAIRGLEANLGAHNADTFHDDLHKTLKANYILANPPFNVSDWGGERLRDGAPQQTANGLYRCVELLAVIGLELDSSGKYREFIMQVLEDMDTNNKSASSAVHQEVNGAYRMVDMLTIIAYEKGVSSDMISTVIDSWKSGDKSASGAPQQLVNGLYRCVELIYLIGNKSDTWGIWSSYFSSVYDNWVDINKSCKGAPQQAANGMYRIVEMLAGWAQTL